jgi:hypothetical protein
MEISRGRVLDIGTNYGVKAIPDPPNSRCTCTHAFASDISFGKATALDRFFPERQEPTFPESVVIRPLSFPEYSRDIAIDATDLPPSANGQRDS